MIPFSICTERLQKVNQITGLTLGVTGSTTYSIAANRTQAAGLHRPSSRTTDRLVHHLPKFAKRIRKEALTLSTDFFGQGIQSVRSVDPG
jgi:hypothetical protein